MKLNRFALLVLALVLVVLPTATFAHGMNMTIEGNTVLVEYDGTPPTPAENAEVVLFDASGAELNKGTTNGEGKYEFDSSLAVASGEAGDGMGHKATAKVGEVQKSIPKLPIVIGVFAVIAVIFFISSKKKKNA